MKRLCALLLTLALLAGCAPAPAEDGKTHILCTTYPIYLFTTAITQGAEGVEVELLVDQQVSCLHNYTLTVRDMKAIERADIIVMNGAGLEEFMDDALAHSDAQIIDCSENIDLLPSLDHHHHDDEDEDEHEVDPHYWMDPRKADQMRGAILDALLELDPEHRSRYLDNDLEITRIFEERLGIVIAQFWTAQSPWAYLDIQNNCATLDFITFHDGFQYFAQAYGLQLLKSIEEEEGAEASARELMEVIELVEEYDIPAIFVEKNGSRRSADVIARETGCKVVELDMIMSGEDQGIGPYVQAMEHNLNAVKEALS